MTDYDLNYISDEEYQESYTASPQKRKRKSRSTNDAGSPSSSHKSRSSLRSRDRNRGWSLNSLYNRLMRSFHRAWKEVRFKDETDPDVLEPSVVRNTIHGIDTLARTTKFNKRELQLMYRGFKAECPTGNVSEETFKCIYSQFFPQGDVTAYAHYVFNTFDTENSGSISFEDFVTILSELSRGTTSEKLRWAFNLYDINGDGCITKEEMLDIVSAIYSLLGRNAVPSVQENTTHEHVDRIFEKLDINGDGVVTIDEFMEICTTDETIANSMTLLDTCF